MRPASCLGLLVLTLSAVVKQQHYPGAQGLHLKTSFYTVPVDQYSVGGVMETILFRETQGKLFSKRWLLDDILPLIPPLT